MVDDFLSGRTWGVLLILLSLTAGCIHQDTTETYYEEDYWRGDFTVVGEPILNQEVEVTFTVSPVTESFNTKIYLFFSEGVKLVEGTSYWEGDLVENERVEITIRVQPVQEGQHEIHAYVEGVLDNMADRSRNYYLFFLTSRDRGEVSRTKFYTDIPLEGRSLDIPIGLILRSTCMLKAGEEVVLTFSVLATKDIPDVKAVIVLPKEFIFIGGTLEWAGDLKKEKEETFQVIIRTTEIGRFELMGILTYEGKELDIMYTFFVS